MKANEGKNKTLMVLHKEENKVTEAQAMDMADLTMWEVMEEGVDHVAHTDVAAQENMIQSLLDNLIFSINW